MRRAAALWAARARRSGRPGCATFASVPATSTTPPRPRAWLLVVPPATAAFLSFWQLERRRWKVDLLAGWEEALKVRHCFVCVCGGVALGVKRVFFILLFLPQTAPVPLSDLPPAPPPLTRVMIHGATLTPSATVRVGPRPRAEAGGTRSGALVVTPITHAGRHALLVRGWAPADWVEEGGGRGGAPLPANTPTLAVVRASEAPSRFVPQNNPSASAWHWLDATALAVAAGLPPDTVLLEAVTESDTLTRAPTAQEIVTGRAAGGRADTRAYPLPRTLADVASVSVTPATHAQYAATWGTLSAATAALAVKALRK